MVAESLSYSALQEHAGNTEIGFPAAVLDGGAPATL
jgi:hypothetical protein